METALVIVIVLIVLAVVDLTVGVANDAVNFLNSALGSQAASFKVVMIIAALGVFVGVLFSSGMMEVARKGIFRPEMFLMMELLVIFIAVMFQDILLLDFFNTFGLPTSTTVSIVFGLFGSSFAISLIKISQASNGIHEILEYINTASLIKIVSAIFLSIIIAFVVGAIIQYLTRLIFSFQYKERFRKYGAIWAGFTLTLLSFFILLKGAKNAPFIPADTTTWIHANFALLFLYIFIGWTIVLQLLIWFTKINVLKFIVLLGTFALAMAFAANDLVNFIGAPLAGLNAYTYAVSQPDPLNASMEVLTESVKAKPLYLLAAGAIMVTTLFLSRKAKSVAYTTIRLSRQEEGFEQFDSNPAARMIVRTVINVIDFIKRVVPEKTRIAISKRFDASKYIPEVDKEGNPQAFDLIRASVILMVAAGLISYATSKGLPLSTTYVTFIVAMAAALPDGAWGRDSAVYRVSGVLTVVGGWFLTAFLAALVAGLIAVTIYYLEIYAVAGFFVLTAYVLYRSRFTAKKRDEKHKLMEGRDLVISDDKEKTISNVFDRIVMFLKEVRTNIKLSREGLAESNLSKLKKAKHTAKDLNIATEFIIKEVLKAIKITPDKYIDADKHYVRALGAFQDAADRLKYATKQSYDYLDNNLSILTDEQKEELCSVSKEFDTFLQKSIDMIEKNDYDKLDELHKDYDKLNDHLKSANKQQLKRIKKQGDKIKRSILYLNIISDNELLAEDALRICITCKDVYHQYLSS